MLSLIKELKCNDFKVAVLSNVIKPTYDIVNEAGYYDLFDEVIASCKVGYAKPEEEIYKIALDRLSVDAEESIFVDDKQRCLGPAKNLGFQTVHIYVVNMNCIDSTYAKSPNIEASNL